MLSPRLVASICLNAYISFVVCPYLDIYSERIDLVFFPDPVVEGCDWWESTGSTRASTGLRHAGVHRKRLTSVRSDACFRYQSDNSRLRSILTAYLPPVGQWNTKSNIIQGLIWQPIKTSGTACCLTDVAKLVTLGWDTSYANEQVIKRTWASPEKSPRTAVPYALALALTCPLGPI